MVDSFKSTLDEVRESDVLIHVVDISHPNFEEHINTVKETLKDLNSLDKATIMIFNKIDAFTYVKKDEDDLTPKVRENYSLEELMKTWMAKKTILASSFQLKKRSTLTVYATYYTKQSKTNT